MPTPHPIRGRRTNEELFFDHYPQILGWASQLAHLDRADAEDLVQDFYIQVTRINLPLAEVDEIEPYLFKILRNLHYSRLRQKGRSPIYDLSIVDYDSLERGLAVADRSGLFLVRANLKAICEFACQRKNTSRAASIFILRFFMGYYSSEVMQVVQITRMGVDRSLQVARREAQLYLDKPNASRSSSHQDHSSLSSGRAIDDSQALFLELRQAIFNSCEGPCFQPSALDRHYEKGSSTRFTVRELAHLVSCKTCLDRVNTILGLLLLDERSPDDTIGRDNPPGAGSSDGPKLSINRGTKRTPSPRERKALDRSARESFEHRPSSLEISVNGETRTSQRVTAEVSELHLKLNRAEEPSFIEVFSEQRVRLAYLHVTEPTLHPGLEQREHIVLSDGRSLDLTLSFASDLPTVHVIYRDPVFAQIFVLDEEIESGLALATIEQPIEADHIPDSEQVIRFPLLHRFSTRTRKLFEAIDRHMNPLFTSAMILAFASVLCLFFWLRSAPKITASAFLDRAQMRDSSVAVNSPPGVIYQKVRIKAPTGTTERTLYRDAQHRRRVRERELNANDFRLREKLRTVGVDWNDPLSAAAYRDWYNGEPKKADSVTRTDRGLLTLTTTVNDATVVSQSLTVRESDFHTVGRTIKFRDYGTVEIAELNYDVLPWSAVNQDWFEPLAMVSPNPSNGVHAVPLPRLPVRLSDLELDEAELGARLVLSRLHLDGDDRLQLVRQSLGVEVQGVVSDNDAKRLIQSQLYTVPHVSASIFTVQEMASRPAAASDVTSIQQSSAAADPELSALEKYFSQRGMERTAAAGPAQEFFLSSVDVKRQSEEISDLLSRFAANETLSPGARTELSELLIEHKEALLGALEREERQLVGLQLVPGSPPGADNPIGDANALRAMAQRNLALCTELTSESSSSSRTAEQIVPQLEDSIVQLRAVVLRISAAAQLTAPSLGSLTPANQNK